MNIFYYYTERARIKNYIYSLSVFEYPQVFAGAHGSQQL